MSSNILIVDDEPDIRTVIQDILHDQGHTVFSAEDAASAKRLGRNCQPDLVLMDIWMPKTDGIQLLCEWKEEVSSSTPIIMISGHGTLEAAIEAMRLGAVGFLEKPISIHKLLQSVDRALKNYPPRISRRANTGVEGEYYLAGKSQEMEVLERQMQQIIHTANTALIYGELGTGKSILTNLLHHRCHGNGSILMRIDGRSSGEATVTTLHQLLEGMQSTHESKVNKGWGTLHIKDVDHLSHDAQILLSHLLNKLDIGRKKRQGEPRTLFLASSCNTLGKIADDGNIDPLLYHQLNRFPITIPPLRARLDDMPEIIEGMLEYLVRQEQLTYRPFSVSAINLLREYHWPGNLLELQNLVRRVLLNAKTTDVGREEIDTLLNDKPNLSPNNQSSDSYLAMGYREARDHFESLYFRFHLNRLAGNITELAEYSGLDRTHLYRKLKGLGIQSKDWK